MELLIVDDEESALQAVEKGIEWGNLPFSDIYYALNIVEAKKILTQSRVSVLLCDIEMPMGSGLELLEWVNANKPGICCIFMTCHADFSFAQRALRLGSFEYILKPLNFESLEKTLKDAAGKVDAQRQMKRAVDNWEKGQAAVKKQFWRELFIGDITANESSISSYLAHNQLDISIDGKFLPVLISPKVFPESISREDRNLIGFALRNVIDELFQMEMGSHEVEALAEDKVLVILTVKENVISDGLLEAVKDACEAVLRVDAEYFHLQICCYIGEQVGISDIPELIEELHRLDFNNVVWYKSVFLYNQMGKNLFSRNFKYDGFFQESYLKHQGSYSGIIEEIIGIIRSKSREIVQNPDFPEQFFIGIYIIVSDFSSNTGVFFSTLIDNSKSRSLLKKAGNSVGDMVEWLTYIRDVLQDFEKEKGSKENPVERARQYIREHLDEDIAIENLANQVSLNADYLNRIFKKEMGMSLGKYVIGQKMDRAKWLLTHTEWQIGEVAAAVGYYNYSSFSRSFSKMTGKSPQEYKQSIMSENVK